MKGKRRNFSLYGTSGQRKYLTIRERNDFYRVAKKTREPDKRLFLLMFYYTGARMSEVLNLEKWNIDIEDKCIVIECLKRRKRGIYRAIPLPDYFLNELITYRNSKYHHRLWRFSRSSAWRYVRSAMRQADIEGIQACSRGLRHSFAINAIKNNVPLNIIMKWMGHTSIVTTSIYLEVMGDEERNFAARMWSSRKYE